MHINYILQGLTEPERKATGRGWPSVIWNERGTQFAQAFKIKTISDKGYLNEKLTAA